MPHRPRTAKGLELWSLTQLVVFDATSASERPSERSACDSLWRQERLEEDENSSISQQIWSPKAYEAGMRARTLRAPILATAAVALLAAVAPASTFAASA